MKTKPLADTVFEKTLAYQNKVLDNIKTFIGDRPFNSKKLDPKKLVGVVDSLTPEEMGQLVAEFGEHNVNWLIYQATRHRKNADGGMTNA